MGVLAQTSVTLRAVASAEALNCSNLLAILFQLKKMEVTKSRTDLSSSVLILYSSSNKTPINTPKNPEAHSLFREEAIMQRSVL